MYNKPWDHLRNYDPPPIEPGSFTCVNGLRVEYDNTELNGQRFHRLKFGSPDRHYVGVDRGTVLELIAFLTDLSKQM